jgi:hypothetical protein
MQIHATDWGAVPDMDNTTAEIQAFFLGSQAQLDALRDRRAGVGKSLVHLVVFQDLLL